MILAALLLARVGQVLLVAGSVRSKNAAGAAVRLLLDLAVVTLAFWSIGAAVSYANVEAVTWRWLLGVKPIGVNAWAVLPAVLIATGAIHGAVAERTRILPVLLVAGLLTVAYCVLRQVELRMGFAESGVGLATLMGGGAALAAAVVAGPRKGKFNRDLSVNFVPGHNIVLQLVGVTVLVVAFTLFGGFGTLLAASAATLAGAAFGRIKFGKIDTGLTIAATVGGLCAGAVGLPASWLAVLVGIAVGAAVPFVLMTLEVRFRIDDVTAAGPTHLVGGLVGVVVLAIAGLFDAGTRSWWFFGWIALAVAAPLIGAVLAGGVFYLFKTQNALRITEGAEFDGTDLSELDVNAYPDFQQTMIKSYHLREL